jgi:hypothetical protein
VTEDEEEDLSSYYMILKRRDWIALRRREDTDDIKEAGRDSSKETRR